VLTLLFGFFLNSLFDVGPGDWLKEKLSDYQPLAIQVSTGLPERPPSGNWSLVVDDTTGLQQDIGPRPPGVGADCAKLWSVGSKRSGMLTGYATAMIVLRGHSRAGVSISNLTAEITDQAPAKDQALLACAGSLGSTPPIGFTFDLSHAGIHQAVQAVNSDKNYQGIVPAQFGEGYRVNVAENETVVLVLKTELPENAITWHFTAVADVDGQQQSITIPPDGDLHSMGQSPNVKEAYVGGITPINWGPVPPH
jgi:hypothetical protein